MAGKGGGAWKVAYADFVTAMMAFFLVMWITAQSDPVKQAVAEHFSTPFGWSEPKSSHPPKSALEVQRKIIPTGKPAEVVADVKSKKRRFDDISTSVYFSDGGSELDNAAQQALQRLVPHLAGKLQRIEIRGHSSRYPLPPNPRASWDICYSRCLATMTYLHQKGISPERVRISLAAGNEPQSDEADALSQAQNSRVEILLLSEFVRGAGAADRAPE
jgi:chemotaxis protein MotB